MASQGDSKIPTAGRAKEKRRSLLPSLKPITKHTTKPSSEGPQGNGVSESSSAESTSFAEVSAASMPFKLGDHVCIAGIKPGILRYYGTTSFAEGEWCGIALDECHGRHDGLVDGVRYFTCEQGHGIFAPSYKVQRTTFSVSSGEDTTFEKVSKLSPPKASGLPKAPKSKITKRSKSPEPASSVDQISKIKAEVSSGGSKSAPQSPRFTSKLSKPHGTKASSPLQDAESKESKQGTGTLTKELLHREALPASDNPLVGKPPLPGKSQPKSEKSQAQRSSKLPKQSTGLPVKKSSTPGSEQTTSGVSGKDSKSLQSAIPKPGIKKESASASHTVAKGLNETYTISDFREAKLDGQKLTSRAERDRKARSLSYDLGVNPEQNPLNLTFDLKDKRGSLRSSSSSLGSRSSTGSLISPIPDLLTPSVLYGKRTPVEFGGEAMSEPEDEPDFLVATISHASSLGILPDSVLADNNLMNENITVADPVQKPLTETESKDTTELMEKDLDNEISGVSTPDMSSSTLSGKDLCSSPEREFDLTFEVAAQSTSTPISPDKESMAGEMLATPDTSSGSSPDTDKANALDDKSNSSADEKELLEKVVVKQLDMARYPEMICSTPDTSQEGRLSKRSSRCLLEETEQYPKCMRTSVDLDDLEVPAMSASVEIANTAVKQYAELMAAAEQDRIAMGKTRVVDAARRAARKDAERARSVESDDEVIEIHTDHTRVGVVDTESTQLLSDLQAGHARCDRPVSMISTGSADTGIVADMPATQDRKERPLSLVSTSSVDTGYQPDTDSEIGTLTTNSPLDEDSPPGHHQHQHQHHSQHHQHHHLTEELSPRSEALMLDAAYAETFSRFQKAVMKGTIRDNQPMLEADIYSDTGTVVGESDTDHCETDIDDMLEQQTLLEAGLEKLLEASGDQSGPVAPGSLSFASTEDRSPGSSTEEEDEYIALYQGPWTPTPEGPMPMETILEQVTPEEAAERELVSNQFIATASTSQPSQIEADTFGTLQRSSVQGLPPPVEPESTSETLSFESEPSPTTDAQQVDEVNQNQPETGTIHKDLIQLPKSEPPQVEAVTKEATQEMEKSLGDRQPLFSADKHVPQHIDIPPVPAELIPSLDKGHLEEPPHNTLTEKSGDSKNLVKMSAEGELMELSKSSVVEDLLQPTKTPSVVEEHIEQAKAAITEEQVRLSEIPSTVESLVHPAEDAYMEEGPSKDTATIPELFPEEISVVERSTVLSEKVSTEEEQPVKVSEVEELLKPAKEDQILGSPKAEADAEAVVEELIQPTSSKSLKAELLPSTGNILVDDYNENRTIGDFSPIVEQIQKGDDMESSQDDVSVPVPTLHVDPSLSDGSLEEVIEELIIPTEAHSIDRAIIQRPEAQLDREDSTHVLHWKEAGKEESYIGRGQEESSDAKVLSLNDTYIMQTSESELEQEGGTQSLQKKESRKEELVSSQEESFVTNALSANGTYIVQTTGAELDNVDGTQNVPKKKEPVTIQEDSSVVTALSVLDRPDVVLPGTGELLPEEPPDTATLTDGSPATLTEKEQGKQAEGASKEDLSEKEADDLADNEESVGGGELDLATQNVEKEHQDAELSQTIEPVSPGDQLPTTTITSITEHDVLVETLEVTDGPIARTSTPVCDSAAPSDSPAGWAITDQAEPNSGPNTTSDVTSLDTDSANSTLTEGEAVRIVEIEIIPSEMSESTIKDSGPEEKVLVSKIQKDKGKSERSSLDEKKKKNGSVKTTKAKKIEDVAKADQKKMTRVTKTAPKELKSKLTTPSKSNVKEKDNEKPSVKTKIGRANLTKTTFKKPEVEKKTNTRIGSKITDYIKQPASKVKEDNTIVVNNVKTVKNNSNLKKADMTVGERKLPLSSQKRNPPKSKWGNIMTQIEASKDNKTSNKSKVDLKVNGKSSLNTSPTSSTSKATTPRALRDTSSTSITTTPRSPRNPRATVQRSNITTTRRTSGIGTADSSKSKSQITVPRVLTRPSAAIRSTPSPEPARPDSRVSNTSDTSGLNTSRNSSVGRPSSRPSSTSKPENRQAASLRRDRSSSVGSEASTTSQLSSQGSRTTRNQSKESPPGIPKPTVSLIKRRSLIEPSGPRLGSTEPRRASLATSRVTSKKESSPIPGTKPSNQNRNKTVKSTVSSLKRSNQPDVVTNSVSSPDTAEEISRLEALCETRTKQLNIARMQLRTGVTGFEAMTVLVNYLTHELDAFSCPEVTAKLKSVRGQLSDAQSQLTALTEDKAALEKELSELREKNIADLEQRQEEHRKELQTLQQRLEVEKQEEVERVVEKYSHEVSALKTFLEKNISELKTQHEKSLNEQEQQHSDNLKRLQQEQEQRVSGHRRNYLRQSSSPVDLQKQHERRMEEITMTFEHIKFTLSDKVETLRGECEEMRDRERTLQERTQREADIKVHMALAQYKHLPAEIDSLKAVMEMRNQELHELRRKKLDLEKQLEELPQAREKIIALQQKVENLEAIIDIKADYERQLAEKHHVLLRKFDRESKANKRLSMDNEELAWRLSNADSPDMLRRSVSHSPTRSSEATPEVIRRRKSPSTATPISPRSTEFERSPMMHSPPKTNLRRSGTYDLLNKDLDEREMKQSDV